MLMGTARVAFGNAEKPSTFNAPPLIPKRASKAFGGTHCRIAGRNHKHAERQKR